MNSLVDKIHEANAVLIAEGNREAIGDYFTPDYVAHLTNRDMKGGHEAIRSVLDMLRRAFPTLEVDIEILVEGGDRVAWQRTLKGTQEGAFRGFPASGRRIVWRDMVTSQFRDGLIAEEWVLTDLAEQLLMARKR